jgi:hypothetical protein
MAVGNLFCFPFFFGGFCMEPGAFLSPFCFKEGGCGGSVRSVLFVHFPVKG